MKLCLLKTGIKSDHWFRVSWDDVKMLKHSNPKTHCLVSESGFSFMQSEAFWRIFHIMVIITSSMITGNITATCDSRLTDVHFSLHLAAGTLSDSMWLKPDDVIKVSNFWWACFLLLRLSPSYFFSWLSQIHSETVNRWSSQSESPPHSEVTGSIHNSCRKMLNRLNCYNSGTAPPPQRNEAKDANMCLNHVWARRSGGG